MLISLPLIYFCLLLLAVRGKQAAKKGKSTSLRDTFIRTTLIWGATLVVILESLSILKMIHPIYLSFLWSVAIIVTLYFGLRWGLLRPGFAYFRSEFKLPSPGLISVGGGFMLLVLLYIALKAPPNNVDSLLYHMPRVLHWAQNHSLAHYPIGYEHQLWNPIWAESSILNLRCSGEMTCFPIWSNGSAILVPFW
jgi:hypothetical protein